MHRIFVYGTLKSTEIFNFHLIDVTNGKATFVSKGTTCKKYPLVAFTFKQYKRVPGLLFDDEGVGNNVHGEIWDVDDQLLRWLDNFESYPEHYDRQVLDIVREEGAQGTVEQCMTYVRRGYSKDVLELSYYTSYNSKEIGKPYEATD
ncbi:gamma-glutamylaminecyclotransferase-like [Apostichopus japonicus]|uniref:gamma-glutamylaminecyclotransferase-like n=1 Tax=Stichopus japonicus TaxID=307972 RepID=UPI003AB23A1B